MGIFLLQGEEITGGYRKLSNLKLHKFYFLPKIFYERQMREEGLKGACSL